MGFISVGHMINLKRRRKNPPVPSYVLSQDSLARPIAKVAGSPRPSQGLRAPPQHVKLTDLPGEILISIFCLTGVGKDNMLPLTCRYFNQLLSPSRNKWIIDLVVDTNFIADLNQGIDSEFWESKLKHAESLLPEIYKDMGIMESLYNVPLAVTRTGRSIDVRIFEFSFINAEMVQLIHENYGGLLTDSRSIHDQQRHRARYLEWRLAVLDKFVCMANEHDRIMQPVSDESAEHLLEQAELSLAEFRQNYDLHGFSPQIRSLSQCFDGNENMSLESLRKVLTIHQLYETEITNASSLLLAVFKSNAVVDYETYNELKNLLPLGSLSSKDILNLLRMFEMCQRRIYSVPQEQRASHPLQPIIEPLYDLIREVLSSQYRMDQHEDTESIWQVLQEIQIPELLDHVMKLGGPVSLSLI